MTVLALVTGAAVGCAAHHTPSDSPRASLRPTTVPADAWPTGPDLPGCEVRVPLASTIRVDLQGDDRTVTIRPSTSDNRVSPVDQCTLIPVGRELVQFFGGFEPKWSADLPRGQAPVLMHVLRWEDPDTPVPDLCAWGEGGLPDPLEISADTSQLFRVYPSADMDHPRGVAIVFEGLGIQLTSRKWVERRLIDELSRRGWVVLTGVMAPAPDDAMFIGAGVTIGDQVTTVKRADLLTMIADHYVESFDARGAALADATRAALTVLERKVPVLAGTPRVMVGVSMGAIMLPTVAARLDPGPSAAVFVGGGANIAQIAWESKVGQELVELNVLDKTPLSDEEHAAIAADYLDRSRLDPAVTAPGLVDRPVLVIDASKDTIVPPDTGELLWERLGKPERWTYAFGHMRLMLQLHWIGDDIADWIDDALADEANHTPDSAPG